jgi:hypothetical protein
MIYYIYMLFQTSNLPQYFTYIHKCITYCLAAIFIKLLTEHKVALLLHETICPETSEFVEISTHVQVILVIQQTVQTSATEDIKYKGTGIPRAECAILQGLHVCLHVHTLEN